MSPNRYEWASELYDWMLLDPETVALLMAAGCALGFAVALWELPFYIKHRARARVRALAATLPAVAEPAPSARRRIRPRSATIGRWSTA